MDKLTLTEDELCRLIIGQQSLMFHAHNRGEDPEPYSALLKKIAAFREAAAPKNNYILSAEA
jgi:hypothetical protein